MSDRGATLVEFAVVIPVFMMLVIGLFTGANLMNRQLQVSHSARNGASYGASLNLQSGWAAAVRTKIASTAVRDFPASAICVALVTGPGNSPTLVTSGTALDPSTRVVVRIDFTGTLDWMVGRTSQTWVSTSTALWEPYAQYSGSTGIPSAYSAADLTTGPVGDQTCKGGVAASGNNQYAFVPGVTATTTTLPPPPPPPCTNNVNMTSLQGVVRTGSGDSGTKLATRRGGCKVGVNVTWTVSQPVIAFDQHQYSNSPAAMYDNLSVANTSWNPASPAVMLENLPWQNKGTNPARDISRGSVFVQLSFTNSVTNQPVAVSGLSFDVMNIEHQRAVTSERYATVALSNIMNASNVNISDSGQNRSLIYTATMPSCTLAIAGNTPPCALNILANSVHGAPDGSPAKSWAANDPDPSANIYPHIQAVTNLHLVFIQPVTSLVVQFGIVNSNDKDPTGWTWGTDDPAPKNLDGSTVPQVCTNNRGDLKNGGGNPCMQIGMANMTYTVPTS